ncbi:MAG: fasciclin domain-containing protein [Actinomycetota bacterium]|nr:fasciclin domain-containing protein [Actinomycetota bacterium]
MATTDHTLRSSTMRLGLAALASFSLVAAACGGDDDDGGAQADDTTVTTMAEDMADDEMTDESMAEDMADEDMSDDSMADDMADEDMTEDSMGDEMALEPSGPGCAAVPADGEGSFSGMADDPAATAASNNPVLSTLVSAVDAAGLVDTLNGDGPFTIFAPTNDAFGAIPEADLNAVLADTELLTSILTYHVVGGEAMSSADLIEAGTVETVNGASLEVTDVDGTLTVDGSASSVCMDVPTANATVHIIDTVLMP